MHPINIDIYKNIPNEKIPDTESLKDTYNRVTYYFNSEIKNTYWFLENNTKYEEKAILEGKTPFYLVYKKI